MSLGSWQRALAWGTWWVPDEADLNSEASLESLPARREAGLFTTGADGEWSLLLAVEPNSEDSPTAGMMPRQFLRRRLMWGKTQSSTLSLFDATLTDWTTDYETYRHNVWRGPWYVDSPRDWFFGSERVEHVYIEIAAAVPWSDMPPGKGRKHNLHLQWDHGEGGLQASRACSSRCHDKRRTDTTHYRGAGRSLLTAASNSS